MTRLESLHRRVIELGELLSATATAPTSAQQTTGIPPENRDRLDQYYRVIRNEIDQMCQKPDTSTTSGAGVREHAEDLEALFQEGQDAMRFDSVANAVESCLAPCGR